MSPLKTEGTDDVMRILLFILAAVLILAVAGSLMRRARRAASRPGDPVIDVLPEGLRIVVKGSPIESATVTLNDIYQLSVPVIPTGVMVLGVTGAMSPDGDFIASPDRVQKIRLVGTADGRPVESTIVLRRERNFRYSLQETRLPDRNDR
jgi:hypothetical protein